MSSAAILSHPTLRILRMRRQASFFLILLGLAMSGCGATVAEQAHASGTRGADTVTVRGPTVVAYFATTQAEIDGDPDTGEAISDFHYYLPKQQQELAPSEVRLLESYADSILVRRDETSEWLLPRQLSSPVGYLLVAPGKAPRTIEGVATDVDLIEAAQQYFSAGPAAPPSPN